jgi:hypothetical protein
LATKFFEHKGTAQEQAEAALIAKLRFIEFQLRGNMKFQLATRETLNHILASMERLERRMSDHDKWERKKIDEGKK